MNLKECEYILAIAQEGNMSKAAQRLYVSQPALSKMLNKVEEHIGAALFERRSNGMTATAIGQLYLDKAAQLIAMASACEQELKAASGKQPVIQIGLPLLRTELLTRSVLPELAKRFPGLQARYIHSPQSRLAIDLLNNRCNLGIGIVGKKLTQLFPCQVIGAEEFALAVPLGHPLLALAVPRDGCAYPYIEAVHLAAQPFVLSRPDSYSSRQAQQFFTAHQINPPIALSLENTSDVLHAVAGGAGIALLPAQPLRALHAEDRLTYLSVALHAEPDQVGVLYRKGYQPSEMEQAFIDTLRDVYEENHEHHVRRPQVEVHDNTRQADQPSN